MAQPAPNCKGTTFEIKVPGRGGKAIAKGSNATVHATGVVKETGKKFWSTKDPGQQPFSYQAGVGGVIKGWDQGCLGMTVGEVRELVKCESQTLNLRQVRAALATGPATTQVDHGRLGGMLAGRIGENEYLTQYATDNRSKCKLISCKKAILLGELRIGKIPPRVNNEKANKRVHWHRPARKSTAGSGRRDHTLQRSSSVDVDVADVWTHRWLPSRSRS